MSKVKITDQNFNQFFFPAKSDYKPQPGQTLARWRASADLIDGWIKRNVIELLATNMAGAETARSIMRNLVSAQDRDGVKVLREMTEDLLAGKTAGQVAKKPYRLVVEQFYWTKPEYVPDDPHWEIINTIDTREVGDYKVETRIRE